MKSENICLFDCQQIIKITLVLLLIAINWLNNKFEKKQSKI